MKSFAALTLAMMFAAPLTLALVEPAGAQVAEIQPGQMYQAGTRVRASSLGVSFVIPDEWIGTLPQGTEVFLMGSNTRPSVILVSGDEIGSVQEAIGLLSEPLDIDGTNVLQPVGAPVVEDGELTQTYRVVVDGQELTGEAHAFVGPHGIGLAYVAVGPVAQADYYRRLATDLAASTELTTPVAEPAGDAGGDGTWDSLVRGYKLHYITAKNRRFLERAPRLFRAGARGGGPPPGGQPRTAEDGLGSCPSSGRLLGKSGPRHDRRRVVGGRQIRDSRRLRESGELASRLFLRHRGRTIFLPHRISVLCTRSGGTEEAWEP